VNILANWDEDDFSDDAPEAEEDIEEFGNSDDF
jgi:hypothetical protein